MAILVPACIFKSSVCSSLSAGFGEIGAIGRAPIGTVRYPESDGCREYGSLGYRTGAVPRFEQVIGGGYSAWPKEAGATGYQEYTGVPKDVVCADQATVSVCVGWTSQTGTVGCREPDGRYKQATCNGKRASVDKAQVAGSTVEVTSRTPSVWAGVELAKLYAGVGSSDLDSGIAEITQSVYFGQPNQLRPAMPTQSASSYVGYPSAMDMGAWMASVPSWNHSTGSWVQAP